MSDVIGNNHAPVIYWVDMSGMRAFTQSPRAYEKVLATYVNVPSASYVSDLEARLEKAEAERGQLAEQQIAAVNDLQIARNDALEDAVNAIWALDLSEVDPMDRDASREAFETSIRALKSQS